MLNNQRLPFQSDFNRKLTGNKSRNTSPIRLAGLCVIFGLAMVFTSCDSAVDSVSKQNEIQSQTITDASKTQNRVDVCHVNGNGEFNKITIAYAAFDTHISHGDGTIGGEVPGKPGYIFDEDCRPVPDVIIPVEVVLENHGSCSALGQLGPSVGQDGTWFAVVLSPEIYPFTLTHGEITLIHNPATNCDSSGDFQVRVFVVDRLAPPTGDGVSTPVAVLNFPELDSPDEFRILSFKLDTPEVVTNGQHVVFAIDSFRSEGSTRSCIATCPVPKGTHNYYSLNTNPMDWEWTSLTTSSMWMKAIGY